VAAIFNPSVGKYDVMADVGPAFATQRQEAFNAYSQILAQNKELTAVIGDIALRFADFPGAEEAAERLRRMVPQQAMEDGPAPDLLAAQQQIKSLEELVQNLATKLADKTAKHINDQEKTAISAYDAQTKRLAALKDALNTSPEKLVELVRQVIEEAEATSALGLSPPDAHAPGDRPGHAAAPQAGGAPPGGMDHAGGLPENGNPDDMGRVRPRPRVERQPPRARACGDTRIGPSSASLRQSETEEPAIMFGRKKTAEKTCSR
jgi:hypothetical protein